MKKVLSLSISKQETDSKTIKEMQNGLEQMEKVFPVFTPELQWFVQNIETATKNSRKKLIRELSFFWLIAITVFIATFMIVNRTPMIYFILQFVVLLTFIIANVHAKRKGKV